MAVVSPATLKSYFEDGDVPSETQFINLIDTLNQFQYGWTLDTNTWLYASASSFTISGDVTAIFPVGTKLKLTNSTVKYFYVVSATYGAPNTTVTITGGIDYALANTTISGNYYSYSSTVSGFPNYFNYTPTVTYTGGTTDPTSLTFNVAKFVMIGALKIISLTAQLVRGSGDRTYVNITLPLNYLIAPGGAMATTFASGVKSAPFYGQASNRIDTFTGTMTGDGYLFAHFTYY